MQVYIQNSSRMACVQREDFLLVLKENKMRKPGFEPGSQPWQGRILTTGLLAHYNGPDQIRTGDLHLT